jgi:hypothetical protein
MAASAGNLASLLVEGGLSAAAANIIANALANANSPARSQGNDRVDSTPVEQLRLITPDTRRYQLTNLDYSPSQPFQQRISQTPGAYTGLPADHPYKGSQPVAPTAPLATPAIRGKDYIAVDNKVENNAAVAEVSLDIRIDTGGRHVRLDPTTKSLEAMPFVAESQSPQFFGCEFQETENGTRLVQGLRNLTSVVNVALADGSSLAMTGFSQASAVAGGAFEWGDWIPKFTFGAADPTAIAYSIQVGRYTRIGRLVVAIANLRVNTITAWATPATNVRIYGLPFKVNGTIGSQFGAAWVITQFGWNASTPASAWMDAGNNWIALRTSTNENPTPSSNTSGVPASALIAGTGIRVIAVYEANLTGVVPVGGGPEIQ